MKRLILYCSVVLLIIVFKSCENKIDGTTNSSDGVEISFHQEGKGKPALVFIHGWSNNSTIWKEQVDFFSNNYQSVTLDLAGFGMSGNDRTQWTISAFAEDVKSVSAKLDLDRIVLVGFSMGAPVAIETARQMGDKVIGIVLVDALQDVELKHSLEVINTIDSMMMALINNPSIDNLQGTFFKNNIEASYERVLSMIGDNPKIGWSESLREMWKWNNEESTKALSQLKVPVVAINTDKQPTNVDAFRRYVPSFKAEIIPDVGHVIMWDATEEFNRLLEECIQEFQNN